jgi:hypothetical protein
MLERLNSTAESLRHFAMLPWPEIEAWQKALLSAITVLLADIRRIGTSFPAAVTAFAAPPTRILSMTI